MVSRMPPASPAATMFTNRPENAFGCRLKASARVLPASTSKTTCLVTSFSALFSVWAARIESDCTSGSPELIIVANCRVKMTTSRVLMPGWPRLNFTCFGASRMLTRIIRFFRMWPTTSSRVWACIWPFMIWPFVAFLAVYSKSGMASVSPGC